MKNLILKCINLAIMREFFPEAKVDRRPFVFLKTGKLLRYRPRKHHYVLITFSQMASMSIEEVLDHIEQEFDYGG